MKSPKELWLEINGINLKKVKREVNEALRQRAHANRIEQEERVMWTNLKTRNSKVV